MWNHNVTVAYRSFFWAEHSYPIGLLIHDQRAQAAWYYVTLAHKALKGEDEGAVYEGDLDTPAMLPNLIRGVCTMYGIPDPAEVEKFIPMCKEEAERCHYEWDDRVSKIDTRQMSRGAGTQVIQ